METLYKFFETVNKDSEETNLPDLDTPENNEILNKPITVSGITLAIENLKNNKALSNGIIIDYIVLLNCLMSF